MGKEEEGAWSKMREVSVTRWNGSDRAVRSVDHLLRDKSRTYKAENKF